MHVERTGATRIVPVFDRFVIKLPNFRNEWKHFLHGLLANMQERQFSRTGWKELCPVWWSIPGGWLLIMQRARVMTREEYLQFDPEAFCNQPDYYVPAEHKANSFGYIGDKVVAIDYGS